MEEKKFVGYRMKVEVLSRINGDLLTERILLMKTEEGVGAPNSDEVKWEAKIDVFMRENNLSLKDVRVKVTSLHETILN